MLGLSESRLFLLSHSVGQGKGQGQPTFKRRGDRPRVLTEGAVMSHWKGHGHRKGGELRLPLRSTGGGSALAVPGFLQSQLTV